MCHPLRQLETNHKSPWLVLDQIADRAKGSSRLSRAMRRKTATEGRTSRMQKSFLPTVRQYPSIMITLIEASVASQPLFLATRGQGTWQSSLAPEVGMAL